MNTTSLGRGLRALPWIAAIVPPLLILRALGAAAQNVLYWDQWGYVTLFLETSRGHFPLGALWAQVNEHRVPVPFLMQGLLAWATAWDTRAEVWLNFAVTVAHLAVFARLVHATVRGLAPALTGVVVLIGSLYTFWFALGRNWAWGPIMQVNVVVLMMLAISLATAGWNGRWSQVVWLQVLALIGALSSGSGTLLLGIVPVMILCAPGGSRQRFRQASASVALGGAVLAAYFWGWHPRFNPGQTLEPNPTLGLQIEYALAFLGGGFDQLDITRAAYWGGGALVAGSLAVAVLLRGGERERRVVAAWVVPAVVSIGAAVLGAHSRLPNGLHTAHLPRYIPLQVPFAESVLVLVSIAVVHVARHRRAVGMLGVGAMLGCLALAAPACVTSASEGAAGLEAHGRLLATGARCIRPCSQASDACLRSLCWDPELARRLCPQLEQRQLGPFSVP